MTRLLVMLFLSLCLFAGGYVLLFGVPGGSSSGAPVGIPAFQRVDPPAPAFGWIRGRCRLERPVVRWNVPGTRCAGAPATLPTESVVVSEDKALGGCVVALAQAPAAPAPGKESEFVLTAGLSGYGPHVGAARAPVQVAAVNRTACDFCVHGYEGAVTRFNFALAPGMGRDDLESAFLDHAAVVAIRDDCRPGAGAWLHVFEHPWFDVTSAEARQGRPPGEFLLADVPPGVCEVVAWHEPMTRREVLDHGHVVAYEYPSPWTSPPTQVQVVAGEAAVVDFVVPVPGDIPAPPAVHDPHR